MNEKVAIKQPAHDQSDITAPRRDGRWRAMRPVRLWVVHRSFNKNSTQLQMCGVVESIERSVCHLEGYPGEWVRYGKRWHALHTAEDMEEILRQARSKKFRFFNNETRDAERAAELTSPAPFIDEKEKGPWYR